MVPDRVAEVGVAGVPQGAFRIDAFRDPFEFKKDMDEMIKQLKNSPKAAGEERIYIHGEKEAEKREESMTNGIPLDDATWKMFEDYAAKFGIEKLTSQEPAGISH